MMSSSSDDISTCVVCGVSGIGLKLSNEKLVYICTSCALKVEHCTKDGVSDNTSRNISSDAVSDSLSRVDISDDDDNKLFQDPPPNEDCSLCMQPLPFATGIRHDDSLKEVGKGYKAEYVTKDEYAKTLRAHKDCWDEMKSEQRTKALAVCRQLMS